MNCTICGAEMRLIKAGVSKKTGKPYNAFYSCPNCKKTQNIGNNNFSSTNKSFIQVEKKSLKDEPEYRELVLEINELKRATHALWAVLIEGDEEKKRAYELHKIPLVQQSKPVDEEKFNPENLPF